MAAFILPLGQKTLHKIDAVNDKYDFGFVTKDMMAMVMETTRKAVTNTIHRAQHDKRLSVEVRAYGRKKLYRITRCDA